LIAYRPPQGKIFSKYSSPFSRTLSLVQALTDLAIDGPFANPDTHTKEKKKRKEKVGLDSKQA